MTDTESKQMDSKDNVNISYPNGIHDAAAMNFLGWSISMTDDQAAIALTNKCKLNISMERNVEDRQVIWKTTFAGRYNFGQRFILEIDVEHEDFCIDKKMFDLEYGNQIFTMDLNQILSTDNTLGMDKLKFVVKLRCFPGGYITNHFGTRTDFKDPQRAHNIVLLIGETIKKYLATWSRYFDRLFFGEFAEKNKTEIELKDIDVADFHEILCLIHPDRHRRINDSNVVSVLKLADRFDLPSIMSECGEYLQDLKHCKDLKLIDRLELADKYNLLSLLLACLEKIHSYPEATIAEFREKYRDRLRMLSQITLANII